MKTKNKIAFIGKSIPRSNNTHLRNTDDKTQKSFSNNKPVASSSESYIPLKEKHFVVCKNCGYLIDVTEYMKENLKVQRKLDRKEFKK